MMQQLSKRKKGVTFGSVKVSKDIKYADKQPIEVDEITLLAHKGIIHNAEGLTVKELFTKEHKELAAVGEKWMKDTANSGMIVTTLIATVELAAAFTVLEGNNNAGIPIFLYKTSFLIFVVSIVLALFSSIASLLMLLSITTAWYAEEDFLRALPKRLILGLRSLFYAIASMLVVFGAILSIVVNDQLNLWIRHLSILSEGFAKIPSL
ncbi:hypothetical protein LWI28_005489 [Acer negundo]|uniref:PGG domain-containing protein n=1 Tax=Acer negundo TaxID=4023 RepID=A0AAD5J4A0_ACENE|nr:hypothetical protein LWI28_005489 [Acer negundo]